VSNKSRTDLSKVMPKLCILVKDWIYDHPDILFNKDFISECECHHLLGKRRFNDVRRTIMAFVQPWERERFTTKSTYGKVRNDTQRVKDWIINNRHFNWKQFRNKFNKSGNREQVAFSERVSERRFKTIRRQMKKNGEIINVIPAIKIDLFSDNSI